MKQIDGFLNAKVSNQRAKIVQGFNESCRWRLGSQKQTRGRLVIDLDHYWVIERRRKRNRKHQAGQASSTTIYGTIFATLRVGSA